MRHLNAGRRLSKSSAHRVALGRNLALALVKQFGQENREYIVTTLAKAKEYRGFVERLITLGKRFHDPKNTAVRKLAIRRQALKLFPQRSAVKKIFDEIAPRYSGRKGGYMRIVKTGAHRLGDASQKVLLAFVAGVTPAGAPSVAAAEAKQPAVKPKAE